MRCFVTRSGFRFFNFFELCLDFFVFWHYITDEVMAGVGCDVTALVAGINGIQFIAVPNHYICFLFLTSSIAQTRVPDGLIF